MRYAGAMSQTPVHVSDELFTALTTHFDNKQMVELTSAIAWENYRARFNHAFGIEAEGFSEGAYCPPTGASPGRVRIKKGPVARPLAFSDEVPIRT